MLDPTNTFEGYLGEGGTTGRTRRLTTPFRSRLRGCWISTFFRYARNRVLQFAKPECQSR